MLSGAVALSSRKGSRAHKIAGNVFLISMLTASAAGAFLGFRNFEWDNVFGGVLVFYLVATAWITARREEGETGIVDVIGLLVALAIVALAAIYGIEAAQSPTGTKGRSAASDFVVPVAVATLALSVTLAFCCAADFVAHSESRAIFGVCASHCLSLPQPYSWRVPSYFQPS